jgi:hypothetical protein
MWTSEDFIIILQQWRSTKFCIFFTTKRLITLMSFADSLTVDSTYKVIWTGFPCIMVGHRDSSRQFNWFVVRLCSSEDTKDYYFDFNTLRTLSKKIRNHLVLLLLLRIPHLKLTMLPVRLLA